MRIKGQGAGRAGCWKTVRTLYVKALIRKISEESSVFTSKLQIFFPLNPLRIKLQVCSSEPKASYFVKGLTEARTPCCLELV